MIRRPRRHVRQSSYVRWTKHIYNDQSQLIWTRVYHDIPASGEGQIRTHYTANRSGYDSLGRQTMAITPGDTMTNTTYDPRGLPLTVLLGAFFGLPEPNPSRFWQNQFNPYDVDDDGNVTTIDLLNITNYLSVHGEGTLPEPPVSPNVPPPYVDVNGDGEGDTDDSQAMADYLEATENYPGFNKVLITSYEYDNNSSSGGGDGNLTKETQHVDSRSGNDRVTNYVYDWRNRRTVVDG